MVYPYFPAISQRPNSIYLSVQITQSLSTGSSLQRATPQATYSREGPDCVNVKTGVNLKGEAWPLEMNFRSPTAVLFLGESIILELAFDTRP